jgi:hypothetical protein
MAELEETVPEQADDTDSFVESVVNAGSADDLDTLLNEWDERPQAVEESDPTPLNGDNSDRLAALENQVQGMQNAQDASQAIAEVKAHLVERPGVSDAVVSSWLNDQLSAGGEFAAALESRHQDPVRWSSALKTAAKDLDGGLGSPAPLDDRVAAAAFVRGSSTKDVPKPAVTNDDLAKMSDKDFNEYQRSIGLAP